MVVMPVRRTASIVFGRLQAALPCRVDWPLGGCWSLGCILHWLEDTIRWYHRQSFFDCFHSESPRWIVEWAHVWLWLLRLWPHSRPEYTAGRLPGVQGGFDFWSIGHDEEASLGSVAYRELLHTLSNALDSILDSIMTNMIWNTLNSTLNNTLDTLDRSMANMNRTTLNSILEVVRYWRLAAWFYLSCCHIQFVSKIFSSF